MANALSCLVLLVLVVCHTQAIRPMGSLTEKQKHMLASNASIQQFWHTLTYRLEDYVHKTTNPMLRHWKTKVRRNHDVRDKVSKHCLDVIEFMISNPLKHEWIAKMIDANGRLPSGMLSGTTTSLGDYDQCLEIRDQFSDRAFVGKYCLATLGLPRQKRFDRIHWLDNSTLKHPWLSDYFVQWHDNDNYFSMARSLCFPSICSAQDIRHLLLAYYPPLERFQVNVTYCQSQEEPTQYDPRIWIALSILVSACLMVCVGSLSDMILGRDQCSRLLLSFSAIYNFEKLFAISQSNELSRFQFVHGVRALSSIFILAAHAGGTCVVLSIVPIIPLARHPQDMIAASQSLLVQPFYNGFLVVFIFFILSGMLTTYTLASKNGLKLSYVQFVGLRWLRFAPTVLGLLCLTACMELFGNGPLFHHDIVWPNVAQCYDEWYYNLLFINNFLDLDYVCNLHNWYLAADMQIHLVAFVLLMVYVRSSRASYWTCLAFMVAGVFSIILVVWVLKVSSVTKVQVIAYTALPIPNGSVKYLSFSSWMQLIPYFAGAILGLMFLENRRLQLSRFQERLGWTLAIFFFFAIPFASYFEEKSVDTVTGGKSLQDVTALLVASFLWVFANVWFVYQCYVNNRNPLARFLSAPVFQPLSRLSFSFYMVHLMTIWYNVLQTRSPINIATDHETYKNISFTLIQSFFLGMLLYTTFEAPSINLIKLYFQKENKTRTQDEIKDLLDANKNLLFDAKNNRALNN